MNTISLKVCEIFAKQGRYQNFDLEIEGQEVEERDLCHSSGNVRIHISDFFIFLTTWGRTFTQTDKTHAEKFAPDEICHALQLNVLSFVHTV